MRGKWDAFFEGMYVRKMRHSKLLVALMIYLIVPLIIGLVLGYEMSGNRIGNIPTVIMDHDRSEFSRTLIDYIAQNDIFDVTTYATSEDQVKKLMDSGKASVGVIIPQGLSADMQKGSGPKVLVMYDGSVMTVASSAKTAMSEILMTVKSAYMMNVLEGKQNVTAPQALNQVQPINATYRTLYNPVKNYRNFFLPGMLIAFMQVGIGVMGLERAQENRTCGYLKSVRKIGGNGLFGALGLLICLGVQYLFFGLPFKGSLLGLLVLTLLFSLCQTSFGFIMGTMIEDRTFASQATCVLILPASILGGYTFPLMAMPVFFQKLAYLIPLSYYGDAVRSLCLKPLKFHYILPGIGYLLAFLAVEAGLLLLAKAVVRRHHSFAGGGGAVELSIPERAGEQI